MANTPNIRFKGFSDDWVQHKLNEFGIATGGTSIESEFSDEGNYKVISIGSYSEDSVYRDQGIRAIESEKTLKRVLNKGDITMILNDKTSSGNIIGRVLLIEESGVYVYNQRTERIELDNENYDSQFIYTMLNVPEIRDKIIKQSQGNTQIYVNWTTISQTEYVVPQIKEQQRIGDYFRNLDHLITLQQCKCDEIKQLKKFMLQKMFPKNGKQIPEIRFAGFTDDWEQHKLGEMLCGLQNNTLSRAEMTYKEGTIMNIHYGDILVKYGEVIDVKNEQIPNVIDSAVAEKYKTSLLQNGDVIFADTAEDEIVGKCSEIAGLTDEKILSGLHTIPYRPQLKFATGYLGYYLNSGVFHQQLRPLMQGIKVTSISKSAMQNTDIIYPKSFEEQEKIGTYFIQLDHLITRHQHKCDQLKVVKRFMQQNMFPQKG